MEPTTKILNFTAAPSLLAALNLAVVNPHGFPAVAPSTKRAMTAVISLFVDFWGDMEITAVTPQHIAAFLADCQTRDLSPITVNSYLRFLKTFYGLLQKHAISGHNPAQHINFKPEPPPRHRAISRSAYKKLRRYADTRDKAIIDTLWATGARLGGIISMNAAAGQLDHWLDKNGRNCYAIFVTEKFGKSRWVYLKGKQAQSLHNWLSIRPSSFDKALFLTNRNPHRLTGPAIQHILRKARILAGNPPNANAHAFRHAFAIRMLDKGHDLAVVSQWLGHSSPEFTAKVYAVRSEKELRRAYFEKL